MAKQGVGKGFRAVVGLLALVAAVASGAQAVQAQAGPPPIAAPLVREGSFAIGLEAGLGLGTTYDEGEAEGRLADAGISPQNGWIADYPVTPDIIGELQQAVAAAADSGQLSFGRDEALGQFDAALSNAGLSIRPYDPGGGNEAALSGSENYPDPSAVSGYYYDQGPPIVTCYTPPPDFYYLYAWVPFPFWWSGYWFPGFFVLHDFHKTIVVGRRPVFVSNHFRDVRAHRVFRIDPAARFEGRSFGGIGASRRRGLLPTGIPGSERRIFNAPPPRSAPGGATVHPPSLRGQPIRPRSQGAIPVTPRAVTPQAQSGATVQPFRGSSADVPRSAAVVPAPRAPRGSAGSQPRVGESRGPSSGHAGSVGQLPYRH